MMVPQDVQDWLTTSPRTVSVDGQQWPLAHFLHNTNVLNAKYGALRTAASFEGPTTTTPDLAGPQRKAELDRELEDLENTLNKYKVALRPVMASLREESLDPIVVFRAAMQMQQQQQQQQQPRPKVDQPAAGVNAKEEEEEESEPESSEVDEADAKEEEEDAQVDHRPTLAQTRPAASATRESAKEEDRSTPPRAAPSPSRSSSSSSSFQPGQRRLRSQRQQTLSTTTKTLKGRFLYHPSMNRTIPPAAAPPSPPKVTTRRTQRRLNQQQQQPPSSVPRQPTSTAPAPSQPTAPGKPLPPHLARSPSVPGDFINKLLFHMFIQDLYPGLLLDVDVVSALIDILDDYMEELVASACRVAREQGLHSLMATHLNAQLTIRHEELAPAQDYPRSDPGPPMRRPLARQGGSMLERYRQATVRKRERAEELAALPDFLQEAAGYQ